MKVISQLYEAIFDRDTRSFRISSDFTVKFVSPDHIIVKEEVRNESMKIIQSLGKYPEYMVLMTNGIKENLDLGEYW